MRWTAQRAGRTSPRLRPPGRCLGALQRTRKRALKGRESLLRFVKPPVARQSPSASRPRNSSASVGWTGQDLPTRRKGDPKKLAITARLRQETALSLKQLAPRVSLGTSKSANATLHRWDAKQPSGRKREGTGRYMIDNRTNLCVDPI
jgi:hypothetical protein